MNEAYVRARTWSELRELEDLVRSYLEEHPGSLPGDLEIVRFEGPSGAYGHLIRRKLDENRHS